MSHDQSNLHEKIDVASAEGETENSNAKTSKLGRKGDARMHKAVAARLANPDLSLFDALRIGGFDYPSNDDSSIMDAEKVTLGQRKNQLSRRLRLARKNCTDVKPDDKSSLPTFSGAHTMPRDQELTASKPSNIGALALQMKRDGPVLNGLSDDDGEDHIDEQSKRPRIAKYHPEYAPLFVPPSASVRNPFGSTGIAKHSQNSNIPHAYSTANCVPNQQPEDNKNAASFNPPLGVGNLNFDELPLVSQPLGNVFNCNHTSQPRASAVAISSLAASAQAVGLTLEQLAMSLSSNPANLSKIILGVDDSATAKKQDALALHLYEVESKALYSKCMLTAGIDPKRCQQSSEEYLNFALKAWQAEGRRLQALMRRNPTVRDPPIEPHTDASGSEGNRDASTSSRGSDSTVKNPDSATGRAKADERDSSNFQSSDGFHVHRLDGQCGHKAIIHHPKDGVAHIDFVIGEVVECYQGIEPIHKNSESRWRSRYTCTEMKCKHKCYGEGVASNGIVVESNMEERQPKTIPLSEIDLDDPEWNLDPNGSIDGGVVGLFKLGEI
ncbi:unnamed protein product [Cylindrotheca closterium]|uniref:Uncharacterized protein n=1 Tax=Cylindrotheca closterium TaxID=2856 RepID=A0AAD2FP21_9STRA|nr:unnamed protein product [Cylindrotheca closterium]